MSEPIPESIPTSADPRSHRPTKRSRPTPSAAQSQALTYLFDKQPEIQIPESALKAPRTVASLAAPPEIVANVQGSSAGAGSGEFHVYKASRRREYERLRLMEEEADLEDSQKAWELEQEARKLKDQERLGKNRKKREKKAMKKAGKDAPMQGKDNGKLEDIAKTINPTSDANIKAVEEQGIVMHDDD